MKRSLKDLTDKELMKAADRWFSRYIRLRDSDKEGFIRCCTCGRRFFWKESHCGHYSKRNLAHRYNPQNCHSMCLYCNCYLKGEADKHAKHIDKLYGEGTAELLRGTEKKLRDLKRYDYLKLIEDYKKSAKQEAKKRGLEL